MKENVSGFFSEHSVGYLKLREDRSSLVYCAVPYIHYTVHVLLCTVARPLQ